MDAPLTPKIHNKRRLCTTSLISSTSNISSNAIAGITTEDVFDCQSLQRCLKRVRLTSNISPGELRLQRDLRHAVLNHHWLPVNDEEWKVPYYAPSQKQAQRRRIAQQQQQQQLKQSEDDDFMLEQAPQITVDSEDPDNTVVSLTVTRDEQDPMELILRITTLSFYPVNAEPSTAATTIASTTTSSVTAISKLHLQFPRMYPHLPPVVRRIEYQQQEQQPAVNTKNNPNRWTAGNHLTHSNWSNRNSSDSHKCPVKPTKQSKLQRIIIAASPDDATKAKAEVLAAATSAADPDSTAGTVVLLEWSPISRLTDICEWLVGVVLSHNHPSSSAADSQQQLQSRLASPSTPTTCNCSTTTLSLQHLHQFSSEEKKEDDSVYGRETESASNHQHPSIFWSHRKSSDDEDDDVCRQRQQQQSAGESSFFLPHGRFDVGYDRQNDDAATPQHRYPQEAMDYQYADG